MSLARVFARKISIDPTQCFERRARLALAGLELAANACIGQYALIRLIGHYAEHFGKLLAVLSEFILNPALVVQRQRAPQAVQFNR